MGLDAVEVLLDVETAFGIALGDRETPDLISTVGDLHRAILARLGTLAPGDEGCLSRLVFYRLRRAIVAVRGTERARVRPEASVAELFPEPTRHRDWRRLGRTLGLELPALERPAWVYSLVIPAWSVGIVSTVFLVGVALFDRHEEAFSRDPLFFGAAVGLSMAIVAELATRPLERLLPPGCDWVRGLVQAIVSLNTRRLTAAVRRWTPDEVWSTLRGIVAAQYHVDPALVTEDTRFVDLGD